MAPLPLMLGVAQRSKGLRAWRVLLSPVELLIGCVPSCTVGEYKGLPTAQATGTFAMLAQVQTA